MPKMIDRWEQYSDSHEAAYLGGASDVLGYLEEQHIITWEQRRQAYAAMEEPIESPYDDDDEEEEE